MKKEYTYISSNQIKNIVAILIWIILILSNKLIEGYQYILLLYTILMNFILIKKFRHIQPLLIVFIFIATYSFNAIPYFIFNIDISYYSEFQKMDYFYDVLKYHSLFIVLLYVFTNNDIIYSLRINSKIKIKDNIILYTIAIIGIIIAIIIGKSGTNILNAGSYINVLSENKNSPIYEYALLLFIIAYKYSGKSVVRKNIIIIIAMLYSIKSILYGGRIEVIQISILIFILYFDGKLKTKNLILLFIIGYIGISFIGNIRNNTGYILNNDKLSIIEKLNIVEVYENQNGRTYISSNQGEVFYNSAVYYGLIKNDIYDLNFRIKSMIGFIQDILFSSKYSFEEGDLSNYSKYYTQAGGGGLISSYFYTWFGLVGVISIAYFISKLVNFIFTKNREFIILYIIMSISTLPRWFVYSPITLFKLSAYIMIIYFIFNILDIITKKIGSKTIS